MRVGVITVAVAAAVVRPPPPASADGDTVRRVVLVNATADLLHAARTALAPWSIEVVELGTPQPVDSGFASAVVIEQRADRVAWVESGELVVVDNAGVVERRPAPAGVDDAPGAAAVALSLKTVLRLPDVPLVVAALDPAPTAVDASTTATAIDVDASPRERAIRIAPEVTIGGRATSGSAGAQARVSIGVGSSMHRFRFGAFVGFGPPAEIQQTGFRGTWSDIEAGGVFGIALPVRDGWSLEPRLRGAAHVTRLRGERGPDMVDVDDNAIEAGVDLAVRWGDRLLVEGGVGAGLWFRSMSQVDGNQTIFDAPRTAAHIFVGVGGRL